MVRHSGEDFIDVEGIALAPVLSLQFSGVNSAELDAPEADRFPGDNNAAFSQEVFNISVA